MSLFPGRQSSNMYNKCIQEAVAINCYSLASLKASDMSLYKELLAAVALEDTDMSFLLYSDDSENIPNLMASHLIAGNGNILMHLETQLANYFEDSINEDLEEEKEEQDRELHEIYQYNSDKGYFNHFMTRGA